MEARGATSRRRLALRLSAVMAGVAVIALLIRGAMYVWELRERTAYATRRAAECASSQQFESRFRAGLEKNLETMKRLLEQETPALGFKSDLPRMIAGTTSMIRHSERREKHDLESELMWRDRARRPWIYAPTEEEMRPSLRGDFRLLRPPIRGLGRDDPVPPDKEPEPERETPKKAPPPAWMKGYTASRSRVDSARLMGSI